MLARDGGADDDEWISILRVRVTGVSGGGAAIERDAGVGAVDDSVVLSVDDDGGEDVRWGGGRVGEEFVETSGRVAGVRGGEEAHGIRVGDLRDDGDLVSHHHRHRFGGTEETEF